MLLATLCGLQLTDEQGPGHSGYSAARATSMHILKYGCPLAMDSRYTTLPLLMRCLLGSPQLGRAGMLPSTPMIKVGAPQSGPARPARPGSGSSPEQVPD